MSSIDKQKAQVKTLSKMVECDIDPVVLFRALERHSGNKNRMLLESCQIESKQELKSILVNKSALRIECNNRTVKVLSLNSNGDNAIEHLAEFFDIELTQDNKNHCQLIIEYPTQQDEQIDEANRLKQITPIDTLRQINKAFYSPAEHGYGNFLCGLFAFDFIASFEELPELPATDEQSPDYLFYLAEEIIVFDHKTRRCNIFENVFSGKTEQQNYFEQARRLDNLSQIMTSKDIMLRNNDPYIKQCVSNYQQNSAESNTAIAASVNCDVSDKAYQEIVVKLKQEIIAGNIFQVVPSRTFSLQCHDELFSYRILKQTNPSPYMFYMEDEDFLLFGASPESALKYHAKSNQVDLYPIAGTRPRGKKDDGSIDHDLDKRLEAELKLDTKEISEHMMLVDLARNDIARISAAGSVEIPKLLEVDRYSQVMHLVSCVKGELKSELDCFHAYQACMNMGTLTGAPKIKATELIRQTENKRRGSYGGAVGYINGNGDMDTCIVIRSAFCKNGLAHIQAGAGIVYDSDPQSEAEETKSKANAVIRAIEVANFNHQENEVIHHG